MNKAKLLLCKERKGRECCLEISYQPYIFPRKQISAALTKRLKEYTGLSQKLVNIRDGQERQNCIEKMFALSELITTLQFFNDEENKGEEGRFIQRARTFVHNIRGYNFVSKKRGRVRK